MRFNVQINNRSGIVFHFTSLFYKIVFAYNSFNLKSIVLKSFASLLTSNYSTLLCPLMLNLFQFYIPTNLHFEG